MVGLCKDRILLVDPYLVKVQQGVCTNSTGWCLFDCFVASSAVASLTFFVRGGCLIVLLPAQLSASDFAYFSTSAYNSDRLLSGSLSRMGTS